MNKYSLAGPPRPISTFVVESEQVMTSLGRKFGATASTQPIELEAQRVACRQLVRGCERALYQFGFTASESGDPLTEHIDKRAVDILNDVLQSWRETLSALEHARGLGALPEVGWTAREEPAGAARGSFRG